MAALLVEKAPAKINLTLRVVGRRPDGYHELESLVAFADLADTLTLEPAAAASLDVAGQFAGPSGPAADNLVLKAAAALHRRVEGLTTGHFQLEKNIPVAAGIGGGSADAAAALRLLARANNIALDDPRLMAAAQDTGADVPVCLASRARIMRGVGEKLSPPLGLPYLPAVLINPRVAVATRDVFAKFAGAQAGAALPEPVPIAPEGFIAFLERHGNDLTPGAIACAPAVAEVLNALRGLPDALLVRMSGSGATCFALFASAGEAAAAGWLLQAEHKDWWVYPTALG